jgi:hypothetical protein
MSACGMDLLTVANVILNEVLGNNIFVCASDLISRLTYHPFGALSKDLLD